jgi:hypothetical protein
MFFPVTCVDDFYDDVDNVRDFALSLKYSKNFNDNFPGERTECLSTIDKTFFDYFCTKLFSLFFDLNQTEINWELNTHFQKTYQYDSPEKYFLDVNSGWCHLDIRCILGGVIYLNQNPNPDAGTIICKLNNNNYKPFENTEWVSARNNFYNKKSNDIEKYVNVKKNHHKNFDTTLEFKNEYNRMICYDSDYWHRESQFSMPDEDFRLTQVFFITEMQCKNPTLPPYLRSKKYVI